MYAQLQLCRLGFMLVTPFTKGRLRLLWLLGHRNSCRSMYVYFRFVGCAIMDLWIQHLTDWAFWCFFSQGHIKYLRKVMCCFSLHLPLVHANMIGIGSRWVVMIFLWFEGYNLYLCWYYILKSSRLCLVFSWEVSILYWNLVWNGRKKRPTFAKWISFTLKFVKWSSFKLKFAK